MRWMTSIAGHNNCQCPSCVDCPSSRRTMRSVQSTDPCATTQTPMLCQFCAFHVSNWPTGPFVSKPATHTHKSARARALMLSKGNCDERQTGPDKNQNRKWFRMRPSCTSACMKTLLPDPLHRAGGASANLGSRLPAFASRP